MPAASNVEWQKWGDLDPLYGVASWDGKGAGDADPWDADGFFLVGEQDWESFLEHWRRYGVEPGVALEVGCGAGRLTRPMTRFFRHVHGVDVAAGMLERASKAVHELPVDLHLTDGLTLPLADGSVDAVFSTHVFQHLDNDRDAEQNWREIARVLRPGGTLMVHLPVRLWPLGMERLENLYRVRRTIGDWRARWQRRRMQRGGPPIMRGMSYSWSDLEARLRNLGLVDVELSVFRVASDNGEHAVVMARKG